MLKTIVKTGLALALSRSGVNAVLAGIAARTQPLVLGYHSVVEDVRAHEGRAIPANLISVGMLERQLDWIGRRYRFVSLDELGAQLERGAPWAKPAAAVTFDDGYAGVYHHAWPLLRRKGIPAAAFVVTDLLGRAQLQIYDKLYLLLAGVLPALRHSRAEFMRLLETHGIHLAQQPPGSLRDPFAAMRRLYTTCDQGTLQRIIQALESVEPVEDERYPELHAMTWEMVSELDRAGVTIGSHTATHALLTLEESPSVKDQLVKSAEALQRKLGKPVAHFAYPDGRFDAEVVTAVDQAGYRFAYTTCRHRDAGRPLLTIARTLLWERSGLDGSGRFSPDLMSCHASSVFDRLPPCRHGRRAAPQEQLAPAGSQAPAADGVQTGAMAHTGARAPHV
jgi:peptidoglycan/xylan/chitin deacetylase (PgdA/CDA1 family)